MPLLETLLLVKTGLDFLGGVTRASGSFQAGRDARREGDRLAQDAIDRGEQDVRFYEMDLSRLLGAQRVGAAGQGLDLNFGDPARLAAQTERFGLEDVEMIRENAMREAMALRRGGRNAQRQANMQGYGNALNAASGALDLGANAWDSWSRRRNPLTAARTRTVMADPAWF